MRERLVATLYLEDVALPGRMLMMYALDSFVILWMSGACSRGLPILLNDGRHPSNRDAGVYSKSRMFAAPCHAPVFNRHALVAFWVSNGSSDLIYAAAWMLQMFESSA